MITLLCLVVVLAFIGLGVFFINKLYLKEEFEIEQKCPIH